MLGRLDDARTADMAPHLDGLAAAVERAERMIMACRRASADLGLIPCAIGAKSLLRD